MPPPSGDAALWAEAVKKLADAADKLGALAGGTAPGGAVSLALGGAAAAASAAPGAAPRGSGRAPRPRRVRLPQSKLSAPAPAKIAKAGTGAAALASGAAVLLPAAVPGASPAPSPAASSAPAPAPHVGLFGRIGRGLKSVFSPSPAARAGWKQVGEGMAEAFPSGSFGRMGRRAARFKAVSSGLGKAAAGAKAAGMGGLAGGLGAAGGLAARGAALAGGPVGIAIAAGMAAVDAAGKIKDLGAAAVKAAEQFSYASASIATIKASNEQREFQRDHRTGEQIAATAAEMSNAQNDLEDTWASFEILGTIVKNRVAAPIIEVLNAMLTPLAALADMVSGAVSKPDAKEEFDGMVRRVADETERAIARGARGYTKPEVGPFGP